MNNDQPVRDPIGDDAQGLTLDERLAAARQAEDQRNQPVTGGAADANYSMGNRVLAELIGGIGGGAFVGWVIDHFAGTSPWGLLVVMALGIIVAFRSIIKIASRPPE